jgi:hypothetical protein
MAAAAATVSGSGNDGAVVLLGAHIGGQLDASRATIRNDSGAALDADGLKVDQSLVLGDGFTATGSGAAGAVRLIGAHVGSLVAAWRVTITNYSGPALNADRLQVDQNLVLRGGFTATSDDGALRLPNGRIGGLLDASGATITNYSGAALIA